MLVEQRDFGVHGLLLWLGLVSLVVRMWTLYVIVHDVLADAMLAIHGELYRSVMTLRHCL